MGQCLGDDGLYDFGDYWGRDLDGDGDIDQISYVNSNGDVVVIGLIDPVEDSEIVFDPTDEDDPYVDPNDDPNNDPYDDPYDEPIHDPNNNSEPKKNVMGDPIDPKTGLPDVTERFNWDIYKAFNEFCGIAYDFGLHVDSYGNLIDGIVNYPQDYMDYLSYFVESVKSGSPWDLKVNGYSSDELGSNEALYNGQVYRFDDFGNITFGIAAAAYGFPEQFALGGAGFYQVYSGTAHWDNLKGYFDDPRDQEMIQFRYDIFHDNNGCNF